MRLWHAKLHVLLMVQGLLRLPIVTARRRPGGGYLRCPIQWLLAFWVCLSLVPVCSGAPLGHNFHANDFAADFAEAGCVFSLSFFFDILHVGRCFPNDEWNLRLGLVYRRMCGRDPVSALALPWRGVVQALQAANRAR